MESRARFSIITILIIAFALLHSGDARKCYICNSEQSKTCANAPESNETGLCTIPGMNYCSTCNSRLSDGKTLVFRGCFGLVGPFSLDSMDCKICNADLCNGSNGNFQISISMAVLGGLVSLWTTRFILADF